LFVGNENGDCATKTVSDYEKAVLRNEFIEIMKQRFLNGKDREFNYRSITILKNFCRITSVWECEFRAVPRILF